MSWVSCTCCRLQPLLMWALVAMCIHIYIYIYVCMYIYVFDRIELHHVKKYLNVAVSSTFTAHHVYIMVCLFG